MRRPRSSSAVLGSHREQIGPRCCARRRHCQWCAARAAAPTTAPVTARVPSPCTPLHRPNARRPPGPDLRPAWARFRTANTLNPASLLRYRLRSLPQQDLVDKPRRRTDIGALNGAVMSVPESSGSAGHPLFARNAAISATTFGSVTAPGFARDHHVEAFRGDTDRAAGSRATFFALRVRLPVWNQHEPAARPHTRHVRASVGVHGRRPERRTVRRVPVMIVRRSASCVSTSDHWIVGSPSASPRFVVFILLEISPLPETDRKPVRRRCRHTLRRRTLRSGRPAVSPDRAALRAHLGGNKGSVNVRQRHATSAGPRTAAPTVEPYCDTKVSCAGAAFDVASVGALAPLSLSDAITAVGWIAPPTSSAAAIAERHRAVVHLSREVEPGSRLWWP